MLDHDATLALANPDCRSRCLLWLECHEFLLEMPRGCMAEVPEYTRGIFIETAGDDGQGAFEKEAKSIGLYASLIGFQDARVKFWRDVEDHLFRKAPVKGLRDFGQLAAALLADQNNIFRACMGVAPVRLDDPASMGTEGAVRC